jgi:hypothetical protein
MAPGVEADTPTATPLNIGEAHLSELLVDAFGCLVMADVVSFKRRKNGTDPSALRADAYRLELRRLSE